MIKLSSLRSILAPMMVTFNQTRHVGDIRTPSRVTISSAWMVAGIRATTLLQRSRTPLLLEGDHHLVTIFHLINFISSSALPPALTEMQRTTYSKYCNSGYTNADVSIFHLEFFKTKKLGYLLIPLTFYSTTHFTASSFGFYLAPNVPMEDRYSYNLITSAVWRRRRLRSSIWMIVKDWRAVFLICFQQSFPVPKVICPNRDRFELPQWA